MRITHLRTFAAVARARGFHAASERLNITQAAVSARIKTLESRLGHRLLDRGRTGAALTPAGAALLPYAETITRAWDHARGMLGAPEARPPRLRIGVQSSIWARSALDWADRIAASLPEVEVALSLDFHLDMLGAVCDGDLDAAITYTSMPAEGLQLHVLPEETLVLVASRPASLANAQRPPYVRLEWGAHFNDRIAALEPRLPPCRLTIGNGELGLRYVLEHDACAYLPLRAVRPLLRSRRLFRVRRAPRFGFPGYVAYRLDNPDRPFVERAIASLEGVPASAGGAAA